MNEQLVVKNFGPIKDATVDFKRVTVFIGPTGGGKSTLAKLAAIIIGGDLLEEDSNIESILRAYELHSYRNSDYLIKWKNYRDSELRIEGDIVIADRDAQLAAQENKVTSKNDQFVDEALMPIIKKLLDKSASLSKPSIEQARITASVAFEKFFQGAFMKGYYRMNDYSRYIPAERLLVSTLNNSWPSLISIKVDFPKPLLDFAKMYLKAGTIVGTLDIPFLGIQYKHIEERGYIKLQEENRQLPIQETASGIQSVIPLLVLLEHLSRNTEQAQSFIIEEPELNLYPTAQQGLLNWLVEKCTKGENDLTITTHSPYILSHLNLLLYAYQVAEKHPDRREAVAAIVPEASWINPKEFACYHVGDGGVKSLVDEELGLIDNNELDNISGDKADAFDQLISINRGFTHA